MSRRPSASRSVGLAHGSGNRPSPVTSLMRSASGTDHTPVAASASARRSRRRPSLSRASTQWATSSRRTRREWIASMNRARTAASSGHAAAASTSARGRHETRSGPCETRRSSSRYVREIRTQPTVRVVRWGGTRTCTGGVMRQPGRACNAAAVGPASQESGPASSKAAIRRCRADGSPASSSRTLGRTTRHPRPTAQRICASVTPPSRSWRRVARPSWRSTSSAV